MRYGTQKISWRCIARKPPIESARQDRFVVLIEDGEGNRCIERAERCPVEDFGDWMLEGGELGADETIIAWAIFNPPNTKIVEV